MAWCAKLADRWASSIVNGAFARKLYLYDKGGVVLSDQVRPTDRPTARPPVRHVSARPLLRF